MPPSITRSATFSVPASDDHAAAAAKIQAVQRGKLQPVLDTVITPAEVSTALTKLAAQESVGKSVVLFDRL